MCQTADDAVNIEKKIGKTIWQMQATVVFSIFDCHNSKVIGYIASLRLGLSHHPKNKFKHNFQNALKQSQS